MNNSHVSPSLDATSLFEDAACGLLLTDSDGLIAQANRTFCGWMGYDHDELVGKIRIQDLFNAGGRIFHLTHWAPLLRMQGSVAEVRFDLVQRDGGTIPVLMNAVARQHDDQTFHHIAVFSATERDRYEQQLLLARKKSDDMLQKQLAAQRELIIVEARFRNAVETARLHVWHIDPATGTRHFEEGVAELVGLPSWRQISADEYNACIAPEDVEPEAQALSRAIKGGDGPYRSVYRLNGHDGVQRTVLASGRGVFDGAGRLLRFIGILQDITEQRRQRAAIEDRALFAEQMVGIVSHDLRSPLSVILSSAGMLRQRAMTSDQERAVSRIIRAGDRAHRLISDLLDFTMARIGSGVHVTLKDIDLHGQTAEFVEELSDVYPGRPIRHTRSGNGRCRVDPERLFQLLSNLVANAVVYGDHGPITVHSSVFPEAFSVAVHNTGKPIPTEQIPQLFEPMIRGEGTSNEVKSVGLGLYIVREIAHAHRGEITVSSTEECGTSFTLTVPRT